MALTRAQCFALGIAVGAWIPLAIWGIAFVVRAR